MMILGIVIFFTVRLAIARNTALTEAARAQRVQRFMLNLFEGGDKETGPGEGLRVITLLDRGVQEAQDLNNEPRRSSRAFYQTLKARIYQKLGKLDRADSLFASALQERQSIFGADSAEAAETGIAIGLLRIDQERLPDAERLIRENLDRTKRHAPRNDPSIAKATTALGRVLEERGSYDQAAPILRGSGAAQLHSRTLFANPDLASALNELASVHFYAGRYAAAEDLFRRVLAMHRQLYGPRHPLVADDLINVGAVRHDLGYYPEAEQLQRQALDINLSYYGTRSSAGRPQPDRARPHSDLRKALRRGRGRARKISAHRGARLWTGQPTGRLYVKRPRRRRHGAQ